jgi:hypothetical protein
MSKAEPRTLLEMLGGGGTVHTSATTKTKLCFLLYYRFFAQRQNNKTTIYVSFSLPQNTKSQNTK